ncbi:Glycine zipper 2TM domain protein [Tsuneonella dongtanensis]|uniref:17 kDa surface antigen n=1 Tax=Tsuneonella dongtanensis TaxID=692370 RepID=A0A1B2AGI2_9SPHN|nr:glycine zipper 2TM domain-containing protein [Tsuneonella dongtanensis]ANY21246.1 Glycine zipper 2TM domain protein [Tsuneonella dongtanensis]
MHKSPLKTAALVLAVPGLALAAPAAAAPPAHSAAYENSAVWGDHAAQHKRKHHRKHDRHDRYDSRYDGRYYGNGYGYQQTYYGEPVYANTRVWRGEDSRYYCRKSNGTTGLLIGAAGGALLGREIAGRYGDRTLGAILGAAGGALLGREIAQSGARCR